MTKDLEETIAELGPGYREVVEKLLCARDAGEVRFESAREPVMAAKAANDRLKAPWGGYLAAASLLAALALAVFFIAGRSRLAEQVETAGNPATREPNAYTLAYLGDAGKDEIIRTQNPDGSWENDFTTRQNAAALKLIDSTCVAYRKAARYLRSRGLAPITEAELKARSEVAALNIVRCR